MGHLASKALARVAVAAGPWPQCVGAVVDLGDLRVESTYGEDGSISLRVIHVPSGASVHESVRDPRTPVFVRLQKLIRYPEARVAGPGASA